MTVERFLRVFFYIVAVLLLLAAIAVLFFASFDQLASDRGFRSRNGGDLFVGLAAVFGEPLARLLIAASFVGCAWVLWPKRRKRDGGGSITKAHKRRVG